MLNHSKILVLIFIGASFCFSDVTLNDVDELQQKALSEYANRFTEFTKEKNVMGTANSPTGEVVKAQGKRVYNRDDRNNFENNYTYHKYTYSVEEEVKDDKKKGKDKNPKSRKMPSWISAHGKISKGGGSSLLEREVYKLHEKYSKEQEKKRDSDKPEKPKPGIEEESIFITKTVEVIDKKNKKGEDEPYEVKRTEMQEDATREIEKVGTNSTREIEKAAKEKDKKDDAKQLPNSAFLYEGARRALEGLWNSTVSSLAQKRASKVLSDARPNTGLNEDLPTCEKYKDAEMAKINKSKASNADKEASKKELDNLIKDCKQMVATNYKDVNPEFKESFDSKGNYKREFKKGDIKTEDDKERDLRIQLNVLAQGGIRLNEIPSNWKYTDKDETAKVVVDYDDNGNPLEPKELRVDEQIDMYNSQLDSAAKAFDAMKARMPTVQMNSEDILKNKIERKTKRLDQITRMSKSMSEEFGLKTAPGNKNLLTDYSELNASKPKGAPESGEGQTYIDFKIEEPKVKASGADTLYIEEGGKK